MSCEDGLSTFSRYSRRKSIDDLRGDDGGLNGAETTSPLELSISVHHTAERHRSGTPLYSRSRSYADRLDARSRANTKTCVPFCPWTRGTSKSLRFRLYPCVRRPSFAPISLSGSLLSDPRPALLADLSARPVVLVVTMEEYGLVLVASLKGREAIKPSVLLGGTTGRYF